MVLTVNRTNVAVLTRGHPGGHRPSFSCGVVFTPGAQHPFPQDGKHNLKGKMCTGTKLKLILLCILVYIYGNRIS